MSQYRVVLINANEMKPPVAPLALDYIGGSLEAAGYDVRLVDLSFASEPTQAISETLAEREPIAVGISFRNTDDCYYPSCAWFVPRLREIVEMVRAATTAPVVLGGCGFSIFPAEILGLVPVDMAVVGDGETAFLQLVRALESRTPVHHLPGLVWRDSSGRIAMNPPQYGELLDVPAGRHLLDNPRYFREGAMGNIETKRGCPAACIYCADPVAKGRSVRCRPAAQIADEIESLLAQGIDVLHVCDGEFNLPPQHAAAVCEEMVRRRLGKRVRWYCYATVHPFPESLAVAMRRAGCVGINFGVDSGCDRMLAALGRGYQREHIRQAVEACHRAGMLVMLDLLLGAPGEDEASVRETIEFARSLKPVRIGAATGVRVYPRTGLAEMVRRNGPMDRNPDLRGHMEDNDDFLRPVFYFDHCLGDDPGALVCDLIAGDERFFPPPRLQGAKNYNYNDNTVLQSAIAAGHRGAFWDILRRLAEGLGPVASGTETRTERNNREGGRSLRPEQ